MVKMMQFSAGFSQKKIPDSIRVLSVTVGNERIPHRIRDCRIELHANFSGVACIEWEKLQFVHIAACFPFEQEDAKKAAPTPAQTEHPARMPDKYLRTHNVPLEK